MKKTLGKIVLLSGAMGILMSINSMASDDNVSFSGTVKTYQKNTRLDCRYRQTEKKENPWKVCLESSGEGKGTVTLFWLESTTGKNLSDDVYAVQGGPVYYNNPYSSAKKCDVYLTAENNNYNGNSYYVTGIWDEETW